MATSIRKKLDALCTSVFDEMDEDQQKALYAFLKSSTGSGTQEVSEDEDEEEEVKPKKKRVVEEDDDDEEEVVSKKKKVVEEDEDDEDEEEPVKKKKKVVEEDEDDEDEDEAPVKKKRKAVEEDEDDEENADEDEDDEEPVKKKKRPAADEDDEEEGEEDGDDLDSKSVPALKKLAVEAGYDADDLKTALKKSSNEKKTLIKLIAKFNETVEGLQKKKLEVLEKLVAKHDVKYAKPRGRSGPEAKKLAAAKALAAAGYPFEE